MQTKGVFASRFFGLNHNSKAGTSPAETEQEFNRRLEYSKAASNKLYDDLFKPTFEDQQTDRISEYHISPSEEVYQHTQNEGQNTGTQNERYIYGGTQMEQEKATHSHLHPQPDSQDNMKLAQAYYNARKPLEGERNEIIAENNYNPGRNKSHGDGDHKALKEANTKKALSTTVENLDKDIIETKKQPVWKPVHYLAPYWIPAYGILTSVLDSDIHTLAGPNAIYKKFVFKDEDGFLINKATRMMDRVSNDQHS